MKQQQQKCIPTNEDEIKKDERIYNSARATNTRGKKKPLKTFKERLEDDLEKRREKERKRKGNTKKSNSPSFDTDNEEQ